MRSLIFQFSTSHEFSSWVIREVTGSWWSHVDAVTDEATAFYLDTSPDLPSRYVFPPGSLYGASNSPDSPALLGNKNGVALRPWDYMKFLRRRRAVIPVSDEQYERFWHLAQGELGKRFDSEAVSFKLFFTDEPFSRDWRVDDCWFCPELHGWLCEEIKLWDYPLAEPNNRLTPDHLLRWMWPKMSNRRTFWEFPPELTPMDGEEIEPKNLSKAKLAAMFEGYGAGK